VQKPQQTKQKKQPPKQQKITTNIFLANYLCGLHLPSKNGSTGKRRSQSIEMHPQSVWAREKYIIIRNKNNT